MKKAVLIDGNNILFRSYFATAYRGSILRNSKGFPTNALFGFINMLNKIIKEENPSYMMIAFDKGKTFRHEKYKDYKGGRNATPEELKEQFPVAKQIAKAMGIKCFEIDNYEADDIIGTFAKEVDINDDFIATIISSDKDLLQLISSDCEVKLLKTNDFIMMNEKTFFDNYGITPDHMIDLKALMGDSSDNIPGVKGIGEKTALTLLQKYKSLDGVYENINDIKGKTKEKLEVDKDNAYFSKELVTIYRDVPIDKSLDNIKYTGITEEYADILKEYEFFSILKRLDMSNINSLESNVPLEKKEDVKVDTLSTIDNSLITDDFSFYIETKGNYHDKEILGVAIYNKDISLFTTNFNDLDIFNLKYKKSTYDLKKALVLCSYFDKKFNKNYDDLMLSAYILNYNIKNDIAVLINDGDVIETSALLKDKEYSIEKLANNTIKKAKFIYDNRDKFFNELVSNNELDLYEKMDLPITYVLANMEYTGVKVDKDVLLNMKSDISDKMKVIENKIHDIAGVPFNIMSPKQLGKILFEKLSIPYPKKIKDDNYSTATDILDKITDYPIVKLVLEYRGLAKIYSNYIVGLMDVVKEDGKVHTIFNQTLTRTGRLSSEAPNLQNIPIREEIGKLVRKAFVPSSGGIILSSDYSQIELRVFAHMSNVPNLIEAFNSDADIHTRTAMDIFHVTKDEVTKKMRRTAKAVNFGMLYGISSFGLADDLGINFNEAKHFMDHYLEVYPGITTYMNKLIESGKTNGFVSTMFGRRRYLEELKSSNYMIRSGGERMALNTPIQGTSADILKLAMIKIYDTFNERKLKSKMIIQVHDELVFDVFDGEKEEVIKIVKEIMESIVTLKVPLKVDIEYGVDWYEAK